MNWVSHIDSPTTKALSKICFTEEDNSDAFGDGEGGYGNGAGGGDYNRFNCGDGFGSGYGDGFGEGKGGEDDF